MTAKKNSPEKPRNLVTAHYGKDDDGNDTGWHNLSDYYDGPQVSCIFGGPPPEPQEGYFNVHVQSANYASFVNLSGEPTPDFKINCAGGGGPGGP